MIDNLIVPKIASKVPPEKVAKAIVRAVLRKKAEVIVPHWIPKYTLLFNFIFPKMGDWVVKVLKLSGIEQNKD